MELIGILVVSALLGALIGLQREYNQIHEKIRQFAGIRTFILFSILGATLSYVSSIIIKDYWLLVAGFALIAILSIVAYMLDYLNKKDSGATTEVAAILTFAVGILCGLNLIEEAVIFGILITVILTFKKNIHHFAEKMKQKELIAIVQFAVFSLVILPLLPNKEYSPLDVPVLGELLKSIGLGENILNQLAIFNPYHFWWMVILVAGISFLGYILVKFLGTSRGYGLTGLVGGLVSSTAVTLSMASESKKYKKVVNPFVAAVVVASATSFIRVLLEVMIVNNSLVSMIIVPLGLMGLLSYVIAFIFFLRESKAEQKKAGTKEIQFEQPFNILTALKFGLFFVLIIFVAKLAQIFAGSTGLYVAGILSGLADVDAITLTMSKLSKLGEIAPNVAVITIILAVASNTLVKAGMAWFLGEKKFAKYILVIFALILLVGLGSVFLFL